MAGTLKFRAELMTPRCDTMIVSNTTAGAIVPRKPKQLSSISQPVKTVEPPVIRLSEYQKAAIEIYDKSDILFLLGPAGTGKTYLAMLLAIRDMRAGEKNKIICVRPTVQAGEDLGFLPGDLNEKIGPYMTPLMDAIKDLSHQSDGDKILKCVETAALAFMRGRTLADCVGILDEAQNCSFEQLKMYLTRIGRNAKLIITGDPDQCDRLDNVHVLNRVVKVLSGMPGVGVVHIPDSAVVRHPIITPLLSRLAVL